MKQATILATLLVAAGRAQAGTEGVSQTFNYNGQPGGGLAINPGDPVGVAVSGAFNAAPAGDKLVGVTIGLNISGGYNGDYFAFLRSPNGTVVTLLNQPGSDMFGSPASGFGNGTANSFVLSSAASQNIQSVDGTYGQAMLGSFSAAGDLNAFGTAANPAADANGSWELFIDNLGSGGGSGKLTSWTINEQVVAAPEPPFVVAGLLLVAGGLAAIRSKKLSLESEGVANPWMEGKAG